MKFKQGDRVVLLRANIGGGGNKVGEFGTYQCKIDDKNTITLDSGLTGGWNYFDSNGNVKYNGYNVEDSDIKLLFNSREEVLE